MKIKTLNVFSVVINQTVPKRNLGIPVYPTPFGTMLNRIVPKTLFFKFKCFEFLWYYAKRNGSKTSYPLFNMIGID